MNKKTEDIIILISIVFFAIGLFYIGNLGYEVYKIEQGIETQPCSSFIDCKLDFVVTDLILNSPVIEILGLIMSYLNISTLIKIIIICVILLFLIILLLKRLRK